MRGLPNTTAVAVDYDHRPGANAAAIINLGAEDVVVNGGFDDSSAWTVGTNWAIAAGKLVHTAGSTAATYQFSIIRELTPKHLFVMTVSDYVAGAVNLGSISNAGADRSANGTYAELVQPGAGGTTVAVGVDIGALFDGKVDDVAAYYLGATQNVDQRYRTIERIDWSYSAAPTGGKVTVADSTGVIFSLAITAAGPDAIDFGKYPLVAAEGSALVVFLDAGGSGISGKLNVKVR